MFENAKIKKSLKPRKEFADRSKAAFLAVYDTAHQDHRAKRTASRGFDIFAKSLVALGALVALLACASVYADTANVAADSILYPLKRLSENVQLAVAPASEKADLQATFAARRADEISDLETRKPSSTIIAGLDQDLDADIDTSLDDAKKTNLQDGQLNAFCNKVLSALATSSIEVDAHANLRGAFSLRANVVGRFVSQCGADVEDTTTSTDSGRGDGSSRGSGEHNETSSQGLFRELLPRFFEMPSSTVATSSASTTSISIGALLRQRARGEGREGDNDGGYQSSVGVHATSNIEVSSSVGLPL